MLTINFQIDTSNKKPELYVNSLVEDTFNCSLYFRIISAGFNNVSEVDNLFFDLKIKETTTSYDFYTGYNSNNVDGRVFSDFFKYDAFKKYFYTDLIFNFSTKNIQDYKNFRFNVSYSYDIIRFFANNSSVADVANLFQCFSGIKTVSTDLNIATIELSNIHETPLLPQITETLSVKNVNITYATEQERLLKTKVLQKKLSQEQLSKFFSGIYYSRDLHEQYVKGYFVFNQQNFINYVFPKELINLLKQTDSTLQISPRVKILDNSDNVIDEYINKDSEIINLNRYKENLYIITDVVPRSDLNKIGLKCYVELDLKVNTQIKNKIDTNFLQISEIKNISETLLNFVSENYDSNFDIYERPTSDFIDAIRLCANTINKGNIETILNDYYSYTKEESGNFILNLFGLLGFEQGVFNAKNKPENIILFVNIIDSLYKEIKRFKDTFEDFQYLYTYKFNNEYEHNIPINSGLIVYNKFNANKNYAEQIEKVKLHKNLFSIYYINSEENNGVSKFLSARDFIINGRDLNWKSISKQSDFLDSEVSLKNELLKIKKENLGLYADSIQPFTRSSILVYGNNGIPDNVVATLNKISKYKQTKEIVGDKIIFDNLQTEIQYYNVNSTTDTSIKGYFESYTELFFPTYIIQYLNQDNVWQDVDINETDGVYTISPNAGFFRIKKFTDETYNYNFSQDVNYPLYDEYFILPVNYKSDLNVETYTPVSLSDPSYSRVKIPNPTRSVFPSEPELNLSIKDNTPVQQTPILLKPVEKDETLDPQPLPQPNINIRLLPRRPTIAPSPIDGILESTPPEETEPITETPVEQPVVPTPSYNIIQCKNAGEKPYYIVETVTGEFIGYYLNIDDATRKITDIKNIYLVSNENDITNTGELKAAASCEIILAQPVPPSYPEISLCGPYTDAYVILLSDGTYRFFKSEADYKAAYKPENIKGIMKVKIGTNLSSDTTSYTQTDLANAFSCAIVSPPEKSLTDTVNQVGSSTPSTGTNTGSGTTTNTGTGSTVGSRVTGSFGGSTGFGV